ncbi:hypothetical protein [Desulfoferrobacter suflitae]|uniref:hypothetical protein n=1 Tax=Desulfoferrobacter suflitae TaxID=2865782 RepID=UPI002164AFC4|nr:hypothetical protein [Desulfoferrobacter suflitae]MCK8603713.1 hypothetical protein [Desulfoferrobacter suflitae]
MNMPLKTQLAECQNLLSEIKAEYPEGEFDREMLHGEMDFRYRRIKELRRKLDAVPKEVREFCRFTQSVTVPETAIRTFLRLLVDNPDSLGAFPGQGYQEIRKRVAACSEQLQIPAEELSQMVGRMRTYGILDQSYRLVEIYLPIIAAYLTL